MQLMIRSTAGRYRAANKAEILTAAGEILALSLNSQIRMPIESPSATGRLLIQTFSARDEEVFAVLFLDNRHRLIAFVEMFHGTIDGASVHPRVVVKRALELNAAAVIFAHNHPAGIPEPSQADEMITLRLREALGLVEIRVLDHVVVGGGRIVSFAERGLI